MERPRLEEVTRARETRTSQVNHGGRARETEAREMEISPIEPTWPRSEEDKRGWPGRGKMRGVRTELIARGRGGVGDQEGNMSTRGWGGAGERDVLTRRILYTFQLSLNRS